MDNFLIITNEIKDDDFRVTRRLEELLRARDKSVERFEGQQISAKTDCAIVIGGDGTLLIAARLLVDKNIPILGVNLGTMGFLVEVRVDELADAVDHLVRDDYFIEERMLIRGELMKAGETVRTTFALNDLVVAKNSALSIIRYNVIVNGRLLYSYNADGMIVSTPTGSTGYSLSAGGPIVEPTAELFVLTPICAHSLGARSIVLSSQDRVEIELSKVRRNIRPQGTVVSDGISIGELFCGDRLVITKSPRKTKLIKLDQVSFLETMRRKMNV
ncbi:MAG: NAD(+)/NADH kinase [Eubacteriales bacterium]|nr:NAD(+)/NADH kinase [Eubacteriales bacterium]